MDSKKNILNLILIFAFSLTQVLWPSSGGEAKAQSNVGIGTSIPDPSAVLDLTSTDKGFLIPRLPDTFGIASPATALLIYRIPDNTFYYFNGFYWKAILAGTVINTSGGVTGSTGSTGANGITGSTGAIGIFGSTGSTGDAGLIGSTGDFGSTGSTGSTGDAGLIGSTGDFGSTGSTGDAGPVGCSTANYIIKSNGTSAICTVAPIYEDATGHIGINTITPTISFEINATDAIAIPKGTTGQQPVGAPIGSVRFNITTGVLEVFNGTCWQNANTPAIGSTYVQWFNAADPNTIYPCTIWISSDISSGEFIRATGGLSNVASAPLTGTLQNFATQDHGHSSSASAGNSSSLSTSSDGNHNHSGNTSTDGNHTHNHIDANPEIPWDGNYTVSTGSTNSLHRENTLRTTTANGSHSHSFATSVNGLHGHTINPHGHSVSVSVGNINSGNTASETRPSNVAVIFWRRTN